MSRTSVLDGQQGARVWGLRTRRERQTTGSTLVNDVHSQLNPTHVRRYDPAERFQNDWDRHYKTMFAE